MTPQWTPSPKQVEFVKSLFARKVAENAPNREQAWTNIKLCSSNESLTTVINHLKSLPDVNRPVYQQVPAVPVERPKLASEDGLYRNPEDGTLYRLSTAEKRNSWGHPQTYVSVFSVKATQRRLTVRGERVKGKWNRLTAHESRLMLTYTRWGPGQVKVLADWYMSDQDKMEFQYGICLFCYRGLEDERSVRHNYGPVCAKRFGLPWND